MAKKIEEFEIISTEKFERDLKYYAGKKKYFHITKDVETVTEQLSQGNLVGDKIPNLKIEAGGHAYKVRAANTDTKAGKANGYRIIYYVVMDDKVVYLLTIYSKKDDDKVLSNRESVELIAKYCL